MTVNGKIADLGYGPIIAGDASNSIVSVMEVGWLTYIEDDGNPTHKFAVNVSLVGANTTLFVAKFHGINATRRGSEIIFPATTGLHILDVPDFYLNRGSELRVKIHGIDSSGRLSQSPITQLLEVNMFPFYAVNSLPVLAEQLQNVLYGVRITPI